MRRRDSLTADELRRLLTYDPSTGLFRWAVKRSGVRYGEIAGSFHDYCRIRINRLEYKAHRLAWLYVHGRWPVGDIDHINGNPSDNRIENLRECSHAQNLTNTKLRSDNTSRMKGVGKIRNLNLWRATFRGRHIGCFKTPEEAFAAYAEAARTEAGEFARPVALTVETAP